MRDIDPRVQKEYFTVDYSEYSGRISCKRWFTVKHLSIQTQNEGAFALEGTQALFCLPIEIPLSLMGISLPSASDVFGRTTESLFC